MSQHEPLEVRSYDDGWLTVVVCSCNDQTFPTTSRWLESHWAGGIESGQRAIREVVNRQAEALS